MNNMGSNRKQRQHLLIVDPDQSFRSAVTDSLTTNDLHCATARNFSTAVILLQETAFGVVLAEVQLDESKFDGFALLKWCRKHAPNTAVILLAADASVEEAVEAVRQGAFDYLTKPLKDRELVSVIQRATQPGHGPTTAVTTTSRSPSTITVGSDSPPDSEEVPKILDKGDSRRHTVSPDRLGTDSNQPFRPETTLVNPYVEGERLWSLSEPTITQNEGGQTSSETPPDRNTAISKSTTTQPGQLKETPSAPQATSLDISVNTSTEPLSTSSLEQSPQPLANLKTVQQVLAAEKVQYQEHVHWAALKIQQVLDWLVVQRETHDLKKLIDDLRLRMRRLGLTIQCPNCEEPAQLDYQKSMYPDALGSLKFRHGTRSHTFDLKKFGKNPDKKKERLILLDENEQVIGNQSEEIRTGNDSEQ